MTHTLTLETIFPVTHDTYRLRFDKPEGFEFEPGQATLMRLDRDGWREDKHPFTMTSLSDAPHLEFTIKTYPEHEGMTEQIAKLIPGDRVIIGDAWGAITDSGPGVFIAGGAGVTPFIAILRDRARRGELQGCRLIFSNKEERDIILRDEWEEMTGLETLFTLTQEKVEGLECGMIDAEFLETHLEGFDQRFYVCGPPPMVEAIQGILKDHDVPEDRITVENA